MAGKTLTIFLAADLKKFNGGLNDADRGLKGFASNLNSMVGPALIATAAAAGALAIKFAVDGVKAAIEDEAALTKLATTLDNVGLAHDQPMVEEFISSLERSTGMADDELRPAYDRLIRSIGDTAKTNDMLKLSMDIAAGTGATLETVTNALGRAYDGNTGALSKLKSGIDTAVFATGDMDTITSALASTFANQATTSANTFEGQIKRVSLATDNLKEAFGKGFLTAFANSLESTNDMVDGMANLESSMQTSGKIVGDVLVQASKDALELSKVLGFLSDPGATWNYIFEDIAIDMRGLSKEEKEAARQANNLNYAAEIAGKTLEETGIEANAAAGNFAGLSFRINQSTSAYIAYINANSAARGAVQDANRDYKDLAARQKEVNTWTYTYTGILDELTPTINGSTSAVKELTKYEERLQDRYQKRTEAMKTTASDLASEIQLLKEARTAVDSYAAGIENSLSSAINLGAAYQGQFDSDGKKTGQSWISAFDDQINLVTAFGNNLNLLKQSNVPDSLIQELASLGAPVGNAIVEDMLAGGEGLINTLSTKWVGVQATMKTLAGQLVPEGLIAGEATAAATVDGLATQLLKETDRLNKIGKNMAKPVGAKFKAQLLSDIADSIREVEAAGTAARIEKVAQAERQQVALTNQAVAQALQNLLRGADARNGAPIAPLLS